MERCREELETGELPWRSSDPAREPWCSRS